MTLVDKLTEVHHGDLILLDGSRAPVTGYVHDYSMNTITVGTELPIELLSSEKKRFLSLCGPKPTTMFDTLKEYNLKYFDTYKVLVPFSKE
ncbi:MAG: hypothetical protein ACP5N1_06035 [Candidatus Woesearchaeota archaeon]